MIIRANKISLPIIVASILILISTTTHANAAVPADLISSGFTFESNLKNGDTNYPDINYLQYFLDLDQKTAVSASGLGSATNTSSYFGAKTFDAVSRFQFFNAANILVPSGLSKPTGFFGAKTRAVANQVLTTLRNQNRNASAIKAATSTISKPLATSSIQTSIIKTPFPASNVLTAQDNYIIDRVSAKIDKQMSHISDSAKKKTIKDGIIAKLKSQILKSKLQAYLKASGIQVGTSDNKIDTSFSHDPAKPKWTGFTDIIKTAFTGSVAYASDLPASLQKSQTILAQAMETPFGGEYLFDIECTCGDDTLNYLLDYSSDDVLALLYEPGESVLFLNEDEYATYQLGSYADANGRKCEIESGDDCTDIDADGIYGKMPGTGTSQAQFKSAICYAK